MGTADARIAMRDNQVIITEAVQKALDAGWKPRSWDEKIILFDVYKYGMKKITFLTEDDVTFLVPVYEIIFNHDFAKVLWGEKMVSSLTVGNNIYNGGVYPWEVHLQEMALADDPVKYLGENV